jgi:hypothetical protein
MSDQSFIKNPQDGVHKKKAWEISGKSAKTRSHLIMIDELLQGDELPLSYAVHAALHVNSEVFVAAWRFQRHRKVTSLRSKKFI